MDSAASADNEAAAKAKRLGNWLAVVTAGWILVFPLIIGKNTYEFATEGKIHGRGNTLKLLPTLIRAVTPCHIPIFGPTKGYVSLSVAYMGCAANLAVSVWILRSAFCLRKMRQYRRVRRAAILAMIPFVGPWYGAPLIWLSVFILLFLHAPDVRARFSEPTNN